MEQDQNIHSALRRPRLLIQAARAGLKSYAREHHLLPLLQSATGLGDQKGLIRHLRRLEEDCDTARRSRAAEYSPGRHVSLLIALMAELKTLAQSPTCGI